VVPALAAALAQNPSPMVRGHSAWALGRIATAAAREALEAALASETDRSVIEELELAISESSR
jgi:epoxyqueuosine reductase